MPRLSDDRFVTTGSPVSFVMDGSPCSGITGETIASALIASGINGFGRSKDGTPRGPLCGMGVCFECEVSVNGGPAQRACMTKVIAGAEVRSLDYRAGDGLPEASHEEGVHDPLTCDVAVVGAGPAGMTAALALGRAGLRVALFEEKSEIGGQFFKPLSVAHEFVDGVPTDTQYRDGANLREQLWGSAVQIFTDATVWGAFSERGDLELGVSIAGKSLVVNPQRLVLATGAYESMPAFPGWTLPGVMTTGGAQGFVRAHRISPGQRVLIAGNGPLNLQLACELLNSGVTVVAVAESAQSPIRHRPRAALSAFIDSPSLMLRGSNYLWTLDRHRVPLHYGYRILEAGGVDKVRNAMIAAIDSDGRARPDTRKCYEVDAVCIGYTLRPSNELAKSLGCSYQIDSEGVAQPVRSISGETNVSGVYLIGDSATIGGAHVAIAEGRLAAQAIVADLLKGRAERRGDRRAVERHRRFQRNLWRIYEAPELRQLSEDVQICRCEAVSLNQLVPLVGRGLHDLASLKRLTRAGMGLCQGRYCRSKMERLIEESTVGGAQPELGASARLPVKPVLISSLGRQKPEWQGYRTVEMPRAVKRDRAAPASVIMEADTLVIGAGIVGVTTALYLARAGRDVTLLDRGAVNGQASGGNAGSLHLQMLSSDFSRGGGTSDVAARALGLQKIGIATWQELQRETGAEFELEITGGVVVAETESELELLREKGSLERAFGIDVEILSRDQLQSIEPSMSERMIGAAFCADEGKINPMLATPALLTEALRCGVRLREQCEVLEIEHRHGVYRVGTGAGVINCRQVVNAAGGWSASINAMVGASLPAKMAPQQMIVTEPVSQLVAHLVAVAGRHLTMKQAANGNVLIGGGWPAAMDSRGGRAVTLRESLEGNLWVAQRVVPRIGSIRIIRTWATVGVMIDGAPILGELPGRRGFFNAVGANGYTLGPILGRITAGLAGSGEEIMDIRPFTIDRFN